MPGGPPSTCGGFHGTCALRDYPTADPAARQPPYDIGFEPGSELLWADHYAANWNLTQRAYREASDADYGAATPSGTPFCQTGTAPGTGRPPTTQYDYASRRQAVEDALALNSLTGRIGP